ncbi:MAG: leucine-rich repeat domain-containing protein [Leptolyngbyaceae cyanobacterium]
MMINPLGTLAIATSLLTTGLSSPAPAASTFAELCAALQDYRPLPELDGAAAWDTMDALLAAVATEDCAAAEARLAMVTDLHPPSLTTTPTEAGLAIDLPIMVDLQIIAIAAPALTRLDLNGSVVSELDAIAELSNLQELHLANTQLTDLTPLVSLARLKFLDVSHNQIASIAPLADIPTLRSLNLAFNPVTDLSPLGEIYTVRADEEPWRLLDLRGLDYDLRTCPGVLGDVCEGDIYE